jgi:iron complex transport system substrate-binding protein
MQGILKAGYIFDRVEQATEYANWLLNLTETISAKTSTLSENEVKTVLMYTYPYSSPSSTTIKAYAAVDTLGQVCILAGGENIVASEETYLSATSISVELEWILEQDPDYIFLHTMHHTYGGDTNTDPATGLDVTEHNQHN